MRRAAGVTAGAAGAATGATAGAAADAKALFLSPFFFFFNYLHILLKVVQKDQREISGNVLVLIVLCGTVYINFYFFYGTFQSAYVRHQS